ncbi:MAG: amine dehydrogenase [Robiginitomaculum sp.]|nr:MAG: amine dehydrogenase [Robiginitomaculum sp.]
MKLSRKFGIVGVLFTGLGMVACSPQPDGEQVPISEQVAGSQPGQQAISYPAPLGEEEMGNSNVLAVPYAKSWAIIHDANFHSMIDGRFIVFDSTAKSHAYKGSMHGGTVGGIDVASDGTIYIATMYHSRGISGERTDIIAIHDPVNLEKTGEIIVPAKRGSNMPFKNGFRLSGDDSLAFNYNFTPAASISVVDMAAKKFLKEIPIPGCTLAYPMGAKGFASMCGDGTMMAVGLDASGNVTQVTRSEKFNNIDDDSLFMKPVRFGDMLYFPTFTGNIQPIDLSGDTPKPLAKWSLVSDDERGGNWRPGGWQLIAGGGESDDKGVFYILMHADGAEGSHKNGGPEVWVFDVKQKKRIDKIELKTWGVSVAVVGDSLIVTNAEMQLDIYDLTKSRAYSHTFGDGIFTPFVVYTGQGQ